MDSLLDTDVISQFIKQTPDPRVVKWLDRMAPGQLFLSVVSLMEIRAGINTMPEGHKRKNFELWLTKDLPRNFAGRTLPIDDQVADEAGKLIANGKKAGATPEAADALIAATAKVHRLRIATLNRKHFARLGVTLVEF